MCGSLSPCRQFKNNFPNVQPITDKSYIQYSVVITCPGGTASLDLAAALVEENCGKARAVKSLRSMLANTTLVSTKLPTHAYGNLSTCGDKRVEQAIDLMERHISQPISMTAIAEQLSISLTEFNRAFAIHAKQPPSAISRKIRLSNAHWLLLNTTRTITQITHECGFADTAHFTRWFKRMYGNPPKQFRTHRRSANL